MTWLVLQDVLASEISTLETAVRRREEATKGSMIELQMQVQSLEAEAMQVQQLLALTLPASLPMKLTDQVQMLIQQNQSSEEEARSLAQVSPYWPHPKAANYTLLSRLLSWSFWLLA